MKNYKVKALMEFDDVEEKVHREKEDEFFCTKERYEYLAGGNANKKIAVELMYVEEKQEPAKTKNSEDKKQIKTETKKATTRKPKKKTAK